MMPSDEVRKHLKQGLTAVFDADLKGYFDSIPQDKLIKCLQMRIVDRSVLKLIRMWLAAPVEEDDGHGGKKVSRRGQGTPQGGVVSPLLANVYLHWFEKVFYAARADRAPGPRPTSCVMQTTLWSWHVTKAVG